MGKRIKINSLYTMIINTYCKLYNYRFECTEWFKAIVDNIVDGYYDPILARAFVPNYKDENAVRSSNWDCFSDGEALNSYVDSLCSLIFRNTKLGQRKKKGEKKDKKPFLSLHELIYNRIHTFHPDFELSLDDVKEVIIEEKNKYISDLNPELVELQNSLNVAESETEKTALQKQIDELKNAIVGYKRLIEMGYGSDDENHIRDYDNWNTSKSEELQRLVAKIAHNVYRRLKQKNLKPTFLSLFDAVLKPYYLEKYNKSKKTVPELQQCILRIIDYCLTPMRHDFIGVVAELNMADYTRDNKKGSIVEKIREILYSWILYGDKIFSDLIVDFYNRVFDIVSDNTIKNTPQNRKMLDLIIKDDSLITNEERELLFRAFGKDFYHPSKDYSNWDFHNDERNLEELLKKIGNILQEQLPQMLAAADAMDAANREFLINYKAICSKNILKNVVTPFSISFDELRTIFPNVYLNTKGDAEVIYWVIQFNGIWNNVDFVKKLGMSYDEVLDRVSKILNSHINSKCDYDPGKLHKIYEICLIFLRTRQSSLVKKRV